jgi:hypothetical protein
MLGAGAALVMAAIQPAQAQEPRGVVLWDQHIATAMNQMLLSDQACRRNPYDNIGRSCVENQLNLSLDRGPQILSTLDELALFVNDARNVDVNRKLDDRASIHFNAKLATLTHNEAEIQLKLSIQF